MISSIRLPIAISSSRLSVEPSLTTIISCSRNRCPRAESSVSAIYSETLNAGITTDTFGGRSNTFRPIRFVVLFEPRLRTMFIILMTYRLPTGKGFAAEEFREPNHRRDVCQNKIKRHRQQDRLSPGPFHQPAPGGQHVKHCLKSKGGGVKVRGGRKQGIRRQQDDEDKRDRVSQQLVRKKLDRKKTTLERIEHIAISPEIGECL